MSFMLWILLAISICQTKIPWKFRTFQGLVQSFITLGECVNVLDQYRIGCPFGYVVGYEQVRLYWLFLEVKSDLLLLLKCESCIR